MFIYDATFSRNIGSAIVLVNDSHLSAVNSSFINNTMPGPAGAICSVNSTLNISHCFCYHNKAKFGGTFTLKFSTALLMYCTYSNNSNVAVIPYSYSMASIINCSFEGNMSPDVAGALVVYIFSNVTVSHTTLKKNSGFFRGTVCVNNHSSLVISNFSFSKNVASQGGRGGGGGGIYIHMSVLKMFQSRFYNNLASTFGGAVL